MANVSQNRRDKEQQANLLSEQIWIWRDTLSHKSRLQIKVKIGDLTTSKRWKPIWLLHTERIAHCNCSSSRGTHKLFNTAAQAVAQEEQLSVWQLDLEIIMWIWALTFLLEQIIEQKRGRCQGDTWFLWVTVTCSLLSCSCGTSTGFGGFFVTF